MKKLNFELVGKAFCRELSIMNKQDFAKTYAFLFSLFLQDNKYPFWYRGIILVVNGYPFVSKRTAYMNMITKLLVNIPNSNVSGVLIESVGRIAGYDDILASVSFIHDETEHKISSHFIKTLAEFMERVDEQLQS
jgi:hypothetical protein